MKKNHLNYIIIAVIIAGGLSIVSCNDSMHSSYEGFIEDGPIDYPAVPKHDSVKVYPGKNRARITFPLPVDPSVSKIRIYWHNKSDSVEFPIDRSEIDDLVDIMLTDLEEGSYTFSLNTFDNQGNSSVNVTAQGQVYGDAYINALLPRALEGTLFIDDELNISWGGGGEDTEIHTEVYYKDASGQEKTKEIAKGETNTIITDYDFAESNKTLTYSTFFSPDSLAIDSFQTNIIETEVNFGIGDIIADIIQHDNKSSWEIPAGNLQQGLKAYVDREYDFGDVGLYRGLEFIRPANDSKTWSAGNIEEDPVASVLLREDITGTITFYVAQDARLGENDYGWLPNMGWKETGNNVILDEGGTERTFHVWEKEFQAGDEVQIGGTNGNANFFWFFVEVNE